MRNDRTHISTIHEAELKIERREEFGNLLNRLKLLGNGLEVGVQAGHFSRVIRSTWKGELLHLVDRWRHESGYNDVANVENDRQLENYFSVIRQFAADNSVVIHKMESLTAAAQFPDGYFDWIYLDADHSYRGCREDLEAWYPKLKTGGLFAGHDFIDGLLPAGDFGVKSAVEEFISDKDVRLYLTNEREWRSWYFIKPESRRDALVTFAVGNHFEASFNRFFRHPLEAYAERIGVPLFVYNRRWDTAPSAERRSVAWQKLLVFDQPELAAFERVCWLDSDILATNAAENIFDHVPASSWGAVSENNNATPPATLAHVYRSRGLSELPTMLNTGVVVLNRRLHRDLLARLYFRDFERNALYEQEDGGWFEQPFLSHELLTNHDGVLLPVRINRLVNRYMAIHERSRESFADLYLSSVFLHWAGRMHDHNLERDLNLLSTISSEFSVQERIVPVAATDTADAPALPDKKSFYFPDIPLAQRDEPAGEAHTKGEDTSGSPRTTFPGLSVPTSSSLPGPLRICIVSSEFIGPVRNGGIATAFTTLAKALTAAGHRVTLLYTSGTACENNSIEHWIAEYGREGIDFVPLPDNPALRIDAPFFARRSYSCYQWLCTRDYDVIHFPEWGGIPYYSLLAKHQGLAFTHSLLCVGTHGPTLWAKQANAEYLEKLDELEVNFMERESVALADVVISPSGYLLDWMTQQGWKLPQRSFVQQNILPYDARRAQGAHDAGCRTIDEIVFFGRLEARKGPIVFCDALDILARENVRDVRITFLGKSAPIMGSDGLSYVRQRAANWPWATRVITDYDHHQAMRYLRQPGRLAVIPSLSENSPYTVLECLGANIPFIASNVGGIPELIAGGEQKTVCFPPKGAALARRLREIMSSGISPAQPAVDPAANEERWVAWHAEAKTVPKAVSPPATAKPLVSVCITHFNRTAYLGQALDSIKAQDYRNIEIIVVDDGSTDPGALAQLDRLESEFHRNGWRIVRQENRYLGAARNTAARHARGDYLLFMDDDDIAKPYKISTYVRVAQRTGADILTSCMDYFSTDTPPASRQKTVKRYLPLGAAPSVGFFRNCFGGANALIRRSAFEAMGGFTEDYGIGYEDWEFFARAVLRGLRLEVVPEALLWYRVKKESMVRSTSRYANDMRKNRAYLEVVPPALHDLLQAAQGLHRNTGDRSETAEFYQHLVRLKSNLAAARVLAFTGQTEQARRMALDAVNKARVSGNDAIFSQALLDAGDLFAGQQQERTARYLLLRALRRAKSDDNVAAIKRAQALLAQMRDAPPRARGEEERVPALPAASVLPLRREGGVAASPVNEGENAPPPRAVPDDLVAQGKAHLAERNFGAALDAFSRARELGSTAVLVELGDCHANLGHLDEALKLYGEALGHEQTECPAHIGMGVVYLVRGKIDDAASRFDAALRGDPANSRALCGRGMAARMQGNVREGIAYFTQALDADPESLAALHELVKCAYELGTFGEAEEYLNTYLMYHPGDLDMLYTLAGILFKAGKSAQALECIDRILVYAPDYQGGAELKEMILAA